MEKDKLCISMENPPKLSLKKKILLTLYCVVTFVTTIFVVIGEARLALS